MAIVYGVFQKRLYLNQGPEKKGVSDEFFKNIFEPGFDIVLFVTCTKLSLAPGVGLAREGGMLGLVSVATNADFEGNITTVLITWHLRHYAGYTAGQDRSQFTLSFRFIVEKPCSQ